MAVFFFVCIYCTKIESIFKKNDMPRAERVVCHFFLKKLVSSFKVPLARIELTSIP